MKITTLDFIIKYITVALIIAFIVLATWQAGTGISEHELNQKMAQRAELLNQYK